MNIADYIVILIIVITLITGLYKGLLNTLYKLVSYILAVYLSFKLAKPVSGWFQGTSIYTKLQDGITTFVSNLGLNFDNLENLSPENISESIKGMQLPDQVNQSISDTLSSVGGTAGNMLESFVIVITDLILLILCGFILFLIFKVLFSLFGHVIKGISEIPIIKQIDKAGGGLLGIGIGVLIIYLICLVMTFFVSNEALQPVFVLINDSMFAQLFYNNNILTGLLGL